MYLFYVKLVLLHLYLFVLSLIIIIRLLKKQRIILNTHVCIFKSIQDIKYNILQIKHDFNLI